MVQLEDDPRNTREGTTTTHFSTHTSLIQAEKHQECLLTPILCSVSHFNRKHNEKEDGGMSRKCKAELVKVLE